MTPTRLDLTIVIEAGSLRRKVPAGALAAVLGVRPRDLRIALLRLLQATSSSHAPLVPSSGEPPEGVRSEAAQRSERTEIYPSERPNVRTGTPRARVASLPPAVDACVATLVEQLRDPGGEPALRRLVVTHPRAVLEVALSRTLAVPQERIRRSRAAYFTALVRAHVSHSPTLSPYDSSPSSTAT